MQRYDWGDGLKQAKKKLKELKEKKDDANS